MEKISKETIHRLAKDITQLVKCPLNDHGIYYHHDEEDMLKGYAMIVGSEDTPYFGGFYLFEITYPFDYPHSHPVFVYHTNGGGIRFHPNLYKNGKVCLSILNTWKGEQWTSCQTITTMLLTICMVLCKNPLLNEPGVNLHNKDIDNYNTIIEYSNINIAICDIINKTKTIYNPRFEMFYSLMQERFKNNYSKILEFIIQRKSERNSIDMCVSTVMYSMSVCVNYSYLYNKFVSMKPM
jgi:ubiquitin-conjugating enzyme E2 Z